MTTTINVSITNLKAYAERMAKPADFRYKFTVTPRVRDWFLHDLADRASKVNSALSSATIKEKTRLARQEEAKAIIAAYEAIEQAEIIQIDE
ncbi:MAG: hypothetical protein NC117_02885 [Pseudoflavonifractor sp.]|nr:hypothetical protein [Pseudoflavonifractor sp.]